MDPLTPRDPSTGLLYQYYCECENPYFGDNVNNGPATCSCGPEELGLGACPERAYCGMSGPGSYECMNKGCNAWLLGYPPCRRFPQIQLCDPLVDAFGYTCSCASGWEGDQAVNEAASCTDIDSCAGAPCGPGQICEDLPPPEDIEEENPPAYRCTCGTGYEGNTNVNEPATCTDIDACPRQVVCGNDATCMDVSAPGTGYTCVCDAGYGGATTTDGPATCTDIDGCDGAVCGDGATCTDVSAPDTGYTCACNAGYEGADTVDQATTCTDVDECDLQLDDCDVNAACDNRAGNFTCACLEGFEGNGTSCEPLPDKTSAASSGGAWLVALLVWSAWWMQ